MLKVFLREQGKSKHYLKEGKIPGVLYGPNFDSLAVYVSEKEFLDFYRKGESKVKLEFEGKSLEAFLKDIQTDPLTNKIIHFDFYIPSVSDV